MYERQEWLEKHNNESERFANILEASLGPGR